MHKHHDKSYSIICTVRNVGAIGVFWPYRFVAIVPVTDNENVNKDAARAKLREHLDKANLELGILRYITDMS